MQVWASTSRRRTRSSFSTRTGTRRTTSRHRRAATASGRPSKCRSVLVLRFLLISWGFREIVAIWCNLAKILSAPCILTGISSDHARHLRARDVSTRLAQAGSGQGRASCRHQTGVSILRVYPLFLFRFLSLPAAPVPSCLVSIDVDGRRSFIVHRSCQASDREKKADKGDGKGGAGAAGADGEEKGLSNLSKKEIESLLKHGAYHVFLEDGCLLDLTFLDCLGYSVPLFRIDALSSFSGSLFMGCHLVVFWLFRLSHLGLSVCLTQR